MSRRGSVLLVAIGILAVLSVFALSFASIVRLESRAALNTCDAARARMVADAGLERALFLLTRSELADPVTSFHAPWTYRSQDGASWGLGLPLDQAKNPSFRAGVTPEGLAYSGVVSGTYRAQGDHFALKVVDANARLSLNGQQPTLGAMLDALGRAVRDFDARRLDPGDELHDPGWATWLAARRAELIEQGATPDEADRRTRPADPVDGRGPQLVALRASLGGRFESVEQLRAVLSPDDLERLRDHVTADAWLDAAMISWDATGAEVPQWRAPVDVNTASWPVLVACLEGVAPRAAVHPDETAAPIDGATARRLATRIDQRRRGVRSGATFVAPGGEPLRGWADLRAFLRADPALSLTQRAALLANADPNLIHAQRNPDATLHPGLGKRDLAFATTELCFISYGIYEVSSLGRVLSPDGVVAAQVTVHAVAAVYDTVRLLTQADFEAARGSNEQEKSESFPNPVRAVTGSFRVQTGGDGLDEVVFEPILDRDERRRLRVQAASRASGWAQLIADEPAVPRAPEGSAGGYASGFECAPSCHGQTFDYLGGQIHTHHVHLFRFGADLRGEPWEFEGREARNELDTFRVEGTWRDTTTGLTHTGEYIYTIFNRKRLKSGGQPAWDVPAPDGPAPRVVDRVQAFAVAAGTQPQALGLDLTNGADRARWASLQTLAGQLYPPGRRLTYAEDLSPDGLIIRPGRTADVRYQNSSSLPGGPLLGDRSTINLWFKLNLSLLESWSPLFESYTEVGGFADPNVGRPERFKFQVEARLIHAPAADGYRLQVRSRRMSFDGQGRLRRFRIWDPDDPGPEADGTPDPDAEWPDAEDFNAPYYERVVEYDLDEARAGEWHYLYVPYYANVHFPFVDGIAGRILRTVVTDDPQVAFGPWPLADWSDCWDRLAPGGFALADDLRPGFPEVTIDELLTTSYQLALRPPEKGGTYERNVARDLGWGGRRNGGFISVSTRRYNPFGPDHAGTFLADLPAFDVDAVKVGRVIWTQLDPTRWGLKQYDGGDFQSQGAYRYSSEEQRNHLSGRAVPRPRMAMMSDEYVRYWRLVYIDERRRFLDDLRARYEALLRDAAPEAAPTFAAYRDTFVAEQDALAQEEQAILDRWGRPSPPADGGASIAFGTTTELSQEERRVRLRIDFLYFDRAQQSAQPPKGRDGQEWWQATALNVSPVLDDVIVPYQERVRLLRRWEE